MSAASSSPVAPLISKSTADEATIISKLMEMLFSDQKELLTCICTQMLNESLDSPEQTHCVIMNFYNRLNCSLPLMKWAVLQELQTKGIETSLFRGTTPAMRLLPAFLRLVGQDYLELCLSSFVRFFSHATVISSDGDLMKQGSASAESSTAKSADEEPRETRLPVQGGYGSIAEARLAMPCELHGGECTGAELCECVEALLEHVFNLVPWCPIQIRRLLKYSTEETGKMFPQQKSNVVNIFLYLRFFAPALTSPDKYGLINAEELNDEGRKTLILASRIIQWLANGALMPLSSPQLPGEATERLKDKILSVLHNFEAKLIDVDDEETKMPRFSALPSLDYNAVSDIIGVMLNYQGGITRQLEKEFSDIHATMFKRIMALVQQKIMKKRAKLSPALMYRDEFIALDSACSVAKNCTTFTPSESDLSLDVYALQHLTAATNALHQIRHERLVLETQLREQIRQEFSELLQTVREEHAKKEEESQERIKELESEVRVLKAELKVIKRDNKKLLQGVSAGDDSVHTRRRVHSNADKFGRSGGMARGLTADSLASSSLTLKVESEGETGKSASHNPKSSSSSSSSNLNALATPKRASRDHSSSKSRKHKPPEEETSPPPLPSSDGASGPDD